MNGQIIIDDGEYYIEWNVNCELFKTGNAFLCQRKPMGSTEWYCVGGLEKKVDGKWLVDISSDFDEESGSDVEIISNTETPEKAIFDLWENRHRAHL